MGVKKEDLCMSWCRIGTVGAFLNIVLQVEKICVKHGNGGSNRKMVDLVSTPAVYMNCAQVDESLLLLQGVYYYPDMDIVILKEVVSQNPYCNPDKWPNVIQVVNATIQQTRQGMQEIIERSLKE